MKCPRCKKFFDQENRKAEKLECNHRLCSTCVEFAKNRTWCPTCKKQNNLDLQVSSEIHHKVVKVEKPIASRGGCAPRGHVLRGYDERSHVPVFCQIPDLLSFLRFCYLLDSLERNSVNRNIVAKMSLFRILNKSLTVDGFIQENELIEGVDLGIECIECKATRKKTFMKICKTCYNSNDLKKFAICTDCSVSRHQTHKVAPFVKEYESYRIEKACENDEHIRLMIETFQRIVEIGRTFGKDTNKAEMARLFRSFKFFMISFGLLERSCLDDEECEKIANESIYPHILEKLEESDEKGFPPFKQAILMQLKGKRMCPTCGIEQDLLDMTSVCEQDESGNRIYLYCKNCEPFGEKASENSIRTPIETMKRCYGRFQDILGEFKLDAIVDAAQKVYDIRFFGPFDISPGNQQPNERNCIECGGLFFNNKAFVCQTCVDAELAESNGLEYGFYHFKYWATCEPCKMFKHGEHRTYSLAPVIMAYTLVSNKSGKINCFADVLGDDEILFQRYNHPMARLLLSMKKELGH